ncbi:MAG: death domain-containing protein [Proteobacteria bacterium]|nr:death domain-containing protein [Pseudomonadota bacterium]
MGLELGISADSLDAIRRNHRDICEDCYTTILKQWLKGNHPRPTLAALAEALSSRAVGMAHLA